MKISAILLIICILFSMTGCSFKMIEPAHQFKRLQFDNENLGDGTSWEEKITDSMKYSYEAKETVASKLPVYEITPRIITDSELEALRESLNNLFTDPSRKMSIWPEDNLLNAPIICGERINTNSHFFPEDVPDFTMSDSELKYLAQQVFDAIPFIDTRYVYLDGTRGYTSSSRDDGEHLRTVFVYFVPVINGMNVYSSDHVMMIFDQYGLLYFQLILFRYQQIGQINLVPLEDAKQRILNPDELGSHDQANRFSNLNSMTIERLELNYYNYYYDGNTILQPVYHFIGTAVDENGKSTRINSIVNAVPEEYTYIPEE